MLVWCTYLMTNLEFLNEFVTIASCKFVICYVNQQLSSNNTLGIPRYIVGI
jgi:hypothetical protein